MQQDRPLQGQRALVTGGSSGIGRAVAALLIEAGARVAINGRDGRPLDAAATELGALAVQGDVGVEADARRIVETTVEGFGGVDILINNAGFGRFAPLLETSADDMEAVWRTNVLGAFLVGREARDAWSSRARGRSSTWPRRRPCGDSSAARPTPRASSLSAG